MTDEIRQRKADHLDLCATDQVAFRGQTTLLSQVRLVHQSLPELSLDELDLSTELLGKVLRAPLVIAAMTGGHERAEEINRTLAGIAERRGYAFGLGSQRAMVLRPEAASTYRVRDVAPTALVLGNVGVVQAREMPTADVARMVEAIGADALCVHLNPAMELVQPEGDRDFRGCLATLARLVRELPVPVVAKETGNGLSRRTVAQLKDVGVIHVDTSGAGGTSWVGVETLRAEGGQRELGEALWDWGVPTAASVVYAARAGMKVIATGGVATGHDVARAIALGATVGGIARPVFMALTQGGEPAAEAFLDGVERELRAVMLLTGSRTPADLGVAERRIGAELREWTE
ncbi:MAG: type 2 isopentenyl-diphosphate Delta-isomerase [Sandaracinaceae bacterium]|nr:type 2 isopentenyl-diphosphate Delta-isomerase [Sandaracinaceae bacterium]